MPPLPTASATIRIVRAADTGPDLTLTCLVRLVSDPQFGHHSRLRQLAQALRDGPSDSAIPAARVTIPECDPSTIRIELTPIREQDLWEVVGLLGSHLESYVTALASVRILIDYG
jgi:hypothetical protein